MFSRPTRILLVVALLAVIAYMLLGRRGENTASDSSRLAAFDLSRVDGVILQRPGETLRFARTDSLWRMTSPLLDTAEHSTIATLLDALEHAEIARNLGEPGDLSPYGLDSPAAVIKVREMADTVLVLELGKRTVDEAWSYARRGGNDDLLLVPTGIARAAELPRDAYRNRRVVDFQLGDVVGYILRSGGSSMHWQRHKGGWSDLHGVRGDSVAVESLLRRLRGLRVASFPADPRPADAVLLGSIVIARANPNDVSELVFFRNSDGSCIASNKNTGRIMRLEDDVSDLFLHTTTELRDRRLLQFSPLDAERIEVLLPDASGAIVRMGGAWSFPNAAVARVDPERAADFVRALRALKWSEFPAPDARRPLSQSRFSIRVRGAGGTILDEMYADPRPDGTWYVMSQSNGGFWIVDGHSMSAIADQFAKLKTP